MKPLIRITGRAGPAPLLFLGGLMMVPVCFLLSTLPAVCLSNHTPGARVLSYLAGGNPIWVAPWLYYFSLLFYYLTLASLASAAVGIFWFVWRTKRNLPLSALHKPTLRGL